MKILHHSIGSLPQFGVQAFPQNENAREGSAVDVHAKATCNLEMERTSSLSKEQYALCSGDIYEEGCEKLAVRYETDLTPLKPRADILCVGKAYQSGGRPVTECLVSFGVGKWSKTIRVIGNRVWRAKFRNWRVTATAPEPFVSMPVSYEYAYGGIDPHLTNEPQTFAANPIGKGYCKTEKEIDGLPLPNLEDPAHPIKTWKDQPKPMGFGPVGRTWQPRLRKAGTYDEKWIKERAPALPLDFDEGYYNCAPEDQQISGYLRGDEEVRVTNMHPQYLNFVSRLPGIRVRCLFQRDLGSDLIEELTMNLDTLWIDMEQLQMVLVWRGRIKSERLPEDTVFFTVQEELASPPRPRESYRHLFVEHAKKEDMSDLDAALAAEDEAGVTSGSG